MREAAQKTSVSIVGTRLQAVSQEQNYLHVFETFMQEQAQCLVVSDTPENTAQRQLIVELAQRSKLPAIYPYADYVKIGGLIAYAGDLQEQYGRMASYVNAILKGAKPSELPIYQATKFNMTINLKTAGALGLSIPATLLARADEVIE